MMIAARVKAMAALAGRGRLKKGKKYPAVVIAAMIKNLKMIIPMG